MIPMQLEFFNASVRVETNQKRVRQFALGGLITGLLLVTGLASVAIYLLQQAQRQRVEQWAANAQVLLAGNQPMNAAINAIVATGLSQSAFVQFPDHPQFASVYVSLLDVVRDNREQNQLPHKAEVLSVAFSPDGQRIVSGSWDKTVRIWDVSWQSLLPMVCNQLRDHPSSLQRKFTPPFLGCQCLALVRPLKRFCHCSIEIIDELKDTVFQVCLAQKIAASE